MCSSSESPVTKCFFFVFEDQGANKSSELDQRPYVEKFTLSHSIPWLRAWLLRYEQTNEDFMLFYWELDRNEKYWIKNVRERYKFMSKSDFHTITELKL